MAQTAIDVGRAPLRPTLHDLSRTLFSDLNERITRYPPGMGPVPNWNENDGFFPGASGLWRNTESRFPRVVIVGQDFGTTDDYRRSVKFGEDPGGPTWRALLRLLQLATVAPAQCFFTNAIVGLRVNDLNAVAPQQRAFPSNTGRSPAFKDTTFLAASGVFLAHQVQRIRPSLVVLLGRPAAEVFGEITEAQQTLPWAGGFRQWDLETKFNPVRAAINGHAVWVIRLLHPCLRDTNLKLRAAIDPNGLRRRLQGDRAEIQLLRNAMLCARITG